MVQDKYEHPEKTWGEKYEISKNLKTGHLSSEHWGIKFLQGSQGSPGPCKTLQKSLQGQLETPQGSPDPFKDPRSI